MTRDEEESQEIPEGAAVLPEIPEEAEAHPLLLALLHTVVFLAGSDDALVHPGAAGEALENVGNYLRRLAGRDLERVRSDLAALAEFARQQGWGKEEIGLFTSFLEDFGVE